MRLRTMRLKTPIAALAVAALYALLLQGFLGALAPIGPLAAAIHCAPSDSGALGGSRAPADAPAAHDAACCLLACRSVLGPPPAVATLAPRPAQRLASALPRPDEAAGPAPARPVRVRGPPTV